MSLSLIKFTIEGDVIPAARVRFSRGKVFQPKRNRDYQTKVAQAALAAMDGHKPLEGELSCVVRVYRKYQRAAKIAGDIDNLLKNIFDGLNKIIFEDDSQICRCLVEKFTDKKKPRAEVEIEKLERD